MVRVQGRIPALDGVRALAVLAVLAAHAGIPGVSGGFLGVDVFFVLSGYLITSLLLDEHARHARVALPAFWARRARRLLPAALVMITAVVAARPLLPPDSTDALRGDAMSAALWSSNWRWGLQGTDYFAAGGGGSPLQHTWSLAVEEQFYVVWPGVLIAILWIAGPRIVGQRRRVALVAAAGAAVSAVFTMLASDRLAPGRVYFGTDTRAQELLVGAGLAALLLPSWQWRSGARRALRTPHRMSRRPIPSVCAWAGLAALAVLAHTADGSPGEFGGGLMLWASLGAAALIAGLVLDGGTAVSKALSTRPAVALGGISYGVYLWHWPVFQVLDGARTGLVGYRLAALRVGATLLLAVASLLLVERPARRIRVQPRRVLVVAASGVAAALAFTACSAPSDQSPKTSGSALDLPPSVSTSTLPSSAPPSVRASSRSLTTGARRHSGPLVVDVFGDSIAWTLVHYLPATPGLRFVDHTILGCGLVDGGPYRYFGQQYRDRRACDAMPARWRAWVRADKPDESLVVVGRWETMDRQDRGTWTHVGEPAFDAHLASLLRAGLAAVASTGSRVVVATEPYNRRGEQPNGELYPEDNPVRVDAWNRLVKQAVAGRPGADLLDLNRELCPDGKFTWNVNGVQVRSDGVHLTPEGVRWLTPWLVRSLRADRP